MHLYLALFENQSFTQRGVKDLQLDPYSCRVLELLLKAPQSVMKVLEVLMGIQSHWCFPGGSKSKSEGAQHCQHFRPDWLINLTCLSVVF